MPNSLSHLPHEQVDPTKLGLPDQRRLLAGLRTTCNCEGYNHSEDCPRHDEMGERPLIPKLEHLAEEIDGYGRRGATIMLKLYTAAFTVALEDWLRQYAYEKMWDEDAWVVNAWLPPNDSLPPGIDDISCRHADNHTVVVQAAVRVAKELGHV